MRSHDLQPSAHQDTFCRDGLPPAAELAVEYHDGTVDYPDRLNAVVALLDDTIATHGGDRRCLLEPNGTSYTYAEVLDWVCRIGAVLAERGVRPGNRVLLRGPNTAWLAACWLAVLRIGAVAVTTMPMLRHAELSTICRTARVQWALCDERYLLEFPHEELPAGHTLSYGEAGTFAAAVAAATAEPAHADTAADDVALLAFTSGTTGVPKATAHFHRDILASADTFAAHLLRPAADDLFAGTPPLGFTFGLGGLLVFPLRAGAAVLLAERMSPAALADAVAEFRVSVLFTSPTAYAALVRGGHAGRLGTLRRCVSAGEPLSAGTALAFHRATGVRLIDGLGSTEMFHIFLSTTAEQARPGFTGKPVPGYTVRVVDERGEQVPDGVPGYLAVRGPTGCKYLRDHRQRDYVLDGWNVTGDIYTRDPSGYFRFHGRADDIIVSAGYKIAPAEVEEILAQHDAVAEVAVVAVPDAERGQQAQAIVVAANGHTPDDELAHGILAFVMERIALYKCPRQVVFRAELPRTSTGKLSRRALREAG